MLEARSFVPLTDGTVGDYKWGDFEVFWGRMAEIGLPERIKLLGLNSTSDIYNPEFDDKCEDALSAFDQIIMRFGDGDFRLDYHLVDEKHLDEIFYETTIAELIANGKDMCELLESIYGVDLDEFFDYENAKNNHAGLLGVGIAVNLMRAALDMGKVEETIRLVELEQIKAQGDVAGTQAVGLRTGSERVDGQTRKLHKIVAQIAVSGYLNLVWVIF